MKEIEENNKIKSSFLERVNKTDKPLNSLTKKKKRERIQINNRRNERGEISMDTVKIQKTIREYYKLISMNLTT